MGPDRTTEVITGSETLGQVIVVLVFAFALGLGVWLLFRISRTTPGASLLDIINDPLTDYVLASDEERIAVITVLKRACDEGRLLDDEFDRRHRRARKAATRGQLSELLQDLPTTDGYRPHKVRRRPRNVY